MHTYICILACIVLTLTALFLGSILFTSLYIFYDDIKKEKKKNL